MRSIMRAVLQALRSISRIVWERCVETGAWIARLVPSFGSPPAPPDTIEDYMPAPAAAVDDTYAVIKRVVGSMHAGAVPTIKDLQQLNPDTVGWIRALEPRHRAALLAATDEQVREHLRGRKAIRGLLAADRESVQAWLVAKAARRDHEEVLQTEDLEGTLAAVM